MEQLTRILGDVALVEFVALAVLGLWQWRRRRTTGSGWVALSFFILAGVALAGEGIRQGLITPGQPLLKALVAALLVVPFSFYRFAAGFDRPRRWIRYVAVVATVLAVVATAALSYIPVPGMPSPPGFLAYRVLFAVQWGFLLTFVAVRMWRAGRRQGGVARQRMRLLAVAATGLNVQIFLGLLGLKSHVGVAFASQVFTVVMAVSFWLGLVPPPMLRLRWRRLHNDGFQAAIADLVRATSAQEVASGLLPHVADLVGAAGAVLVDGEGRVVAYYGDVPAETPVSGAARQEGLDAPGDEATVQLRFGDGGRLIVWTSRYVPFFGRDELRLLASLGDMMGLAMERCTLAERVREQTAELSEEAARLAEAQRIAHLGSWEWDVAADTVSWSDEMYRLYGLEPQSGAGSYQGFLDRVHPQDRPMVEDSVGATYRTGEPFTFDHRIVLPDGSVRWLRANGAVELNEGGSPVRMLGTGQDITDQKQAEESLEHQAGHDPLTGLPNRTLLADRLNQALARRHRRPSSTAVLFIDVDRFKWLNDSLGHATGDQMLIEVATRLQNAVRPGDTVARFGGDEFVVLCEDLDNELHAAELAQRFAKVISTPFVLDRHETTPTVSIGIAFASATGDETAGELLRDADAAMYQAKEGGRDRYEIFDAEMRARAKERLETESALRRAIDRGELVVFYQPEIDLTTNQMIGVEALVRWEHPDRGLLAPSDFIPLAEETGLIVPLGAFVLKEACRQVAAWHRHSPRPRALSLSVNLSARQLLAPGLSEVVRGALAESGLTPSSLCLEITETVLLEDADSSVKALEALKSTGVRIGVDDFGTGYSSLTYLKRFPVDVLKIDRSFVEGLVHNNQDRAIVSSVIDLAHAFGLTTVGEGVETTEQLAQLRTLGCEAAQGYFWSRPLPPNELARWMEGASVMAPPDDIAPGPTPAGVLIVEDDPSLRSMLKLLLDGADGYRVLADTDDGRKAVALAGRHQPDLVLLDLAMPGMGGLEALPLIRAVAPNAKIVVLTGLEAETMADTARSRGAVGFFEKGMDPTILLDHLAPILSRAAS